MNKWKALGLLYLGIQIGIRLPAAEQAAIQFKDGVASRMVDHVAEWTAEQIKLSLLSGRQLTVISEDKEK